MLNYLIEFSRENGRVSAKAMADYFYAVDGQSNGPLADEQLDNMVRAGTLKPDTLVWSEGMPEWQPYSTVRGGGGVVTAAVGAPAAAPSGGLRLSPSEPAPNAVVCSVCGQTFPPDQVIRYGTTPVCGACKPQFLQRLREGAAVGGALDYATVGKRFLAKFLDSIIIFAVTEGIEAVFGLAVDTSQPQPNLTIIFVVMAINLAVSFGYPIYFLGKWGQTLGKMALGIKVVTPDGAPISYGRATGRVLAEIVTGFTLGIGYLIAIWDSEKRSLHDRLAGTRVIHAPK